MSQPRLLSAFRKLFAGAPRIQQGALVLLLALGVMTSAQAEPNHRPFWKPSGVFTQAGFGEDSTDAYVMGALWDWRWNKSFAIGHVTGYSEASVGRWSTNAEGIKGSAWVTQVGLTPVLRLQPAARTPAWFIEVGVGANVILPIYRSDEKRFSTAFNFGDHIGIGYQFDAAHRHELMVRVQHFSNAGIKDPNPGENFVQLRYSYRYAL